MGNTAKNLDIEQEQQPKPPLKWAGGKRWQIPYLLPIFSACRNKRLVEPFVGGMAVALGLSPERALLNDANTHLINFYTELKRGLVASIPMKNEREFFFEQRERFNQLIQDSQCDCTEAAELFYYMNRTAFNGLCRFNSKGHFNVPFGKYAKINYTKDFTSYAVTFQGWDFTCGDFEKLLLTGRDDFLYVDPPYDVEFTRYSKNDFTWEDQVRLVKWLTKFSGPIVASNQATERIIELYKGAGFSIQTLAAPRRISCTGNRDPAWEMLATKNLS